MKCRYKSDIFLLAGLLLIFFLVSCASAPPAPGPAPGQPPAGGPDSEALKAALERAEQARQRAQDFDASRYFSPEWGEADRQYQAARGDAGGAGAEEAAGAFEDLFRKSLPLYAQDREDEIMEARTQAISEGAAELLPDFLIQADKAALEALALYEAEEYYPAADQARRALDRYRVLKTGAEAYTVRLTIEERLLYNYASPDFEQADEAGDGAVTAYRADDIAAARDQAEEARGLYRRALETALKALAAEQRDIAAGERQTAQELKADVAVRGEFASAGLVYNQAEQALQDGAYGRAVELFQEAALRYVRAREETLEKRRLAENAIRGVEEKVIESEKAARAADLLLEGDRE